jgi:DNA polymerase III sliding clamp (beta) subunit (PCNA family)
MTTSVTFENSTIADAAKRGLSVAPKRGQALEKAAGIMLEVNPDQTDGPVLLRATDTMVFLSEWVNVVDVEGDLAQWRVSAQLFAGVLSKLPVASGKTVTISTVPGKNAIDIKSGRQTARCILLGENEHYPEWDTFDPELLEPVTGLGAKIQMVEWACARDNNAPLTGVHFDGKRLIATDRYRIATIPCEIPFLPDPITVPAGILGTLVKPNSDTRVGSDGYHLLLMPDDHTQIKAMIYGNQYPAVDKIMKRDFPDKVKINRDELVRLINSSQEFQGADRMAAVRIIVGAEEISVRMSNEEVGAFADVLEVPGFAVHERVTIRFAPKNLTDALGASPNNDVMMHYNRLYPSKPIYLDGGSGYESWVIPRKEVG